MEKIHGNCMFLYFLHLVLTFPPITYRGTYTFLYPLWGGGGGGEGGGGGGRVAIVLYLKSLPTPGTCVNINGTCCLSCLFYVVIVWLEKLEELLGFPLLIDNLSLVESLGMSLAYTYSIQVIGRVPSSGSQVCVYTKGLGTKLLYLISRPLSQSTAV